jgi:uncharacterized protein YutE (UPF0331/DUF86 family)
MVGKYKELPTPGTYHEAIDILGDYEIIPREFSYSFAGIAGFRNLLAHDYERLDYLRICLEMFDLLNDVKKYIEYIDKKIF